MALRGQLDGFRRGRPGGLPPGALARVAVAAALVAGGLCPGATAAQEEGSGDGAATDTADLFSATLRAHGHPFRLQEGRLVGEGADFLLREAREAAFLVVGEDHGVAEIPRVVADAFERLVGHGYRHLAIETSPTVAGVLEELARTDSTALMDYAASEGVRIPFYSLREESRLLYRAVRALEGRRGVLWGLDQEFIAGTEIGLRKLYEYAPDEEARKLARDELKRAGYGLMAARHGERDELWLVSRDTADFARLRRAFAGSDSALALIERLATSSRLYELVFADSVYESSVLRERLLKENFMDHYRRATGRDGRPPRVVVKVGAAHAIRGKKLFSRAFSLGNFLSELAVSRNEESFHVLMLGGKGSLTARIGPNFAFRKGRTAATGAAWLEPVIQELPEQGWTLFDLRPLRPLLVEGRVETNPALERMIWGFDGLAILTGSRPASVE